MAIAQMLREVNAATASGTFVPRSLPCRRDMKNGSAANAFETWIRQLPEPSGSRVDSEITLGCT